MPKSPSASSQRLEDQLKRLDTIVETLEGQDVALDDALALFEEGIRLTRDCRRRLEDTRQKIEVLVKETGELKPFESLETN